MHRRVGIILFGYGLGNSPSLINTGTHLAGRGYQVDFFTCNTYLGKNDLFQDSRIHIYDYPINIGSSNLTEKLKNFIHSKIVGRLLPTSTDKQIENLEAQLLTSLRNYAEWIVEMAGEKQYDCLIGVEPFGLAAASLVQEKSGFKLGYYNLELWLSSEVHRLKDRVQKRAEVRSIHNASFIISLDEERARLLAEDNGIQLNRFVIMPVCADGPRFEKRSTFLREKLGIPDGKIILIYAGFLSDWSYCEDLARSASTWPDDLALVLHSHGYHNHNYLKRLKRYEGENVFISLDPVAYENLPVLLSSADIGIALYRNIGKNFHLIDSASGKIAHYLQAGLPVIVNDFPGIRNVVDGYNCGLSVKDIEDVPGAAGRIIKNYIAMHNNAFRCYEENYVFSKHFSAVVDRIEMLSLRW